MMTKENNSIATVVGIMSVFFLQMTAMAIMPAMAQFYNVWADKPAILVNYIVTIATAFSILGSLFFGWLVGRGARYKVVAVTGALLYIIGGCIPTFIQDFYVAFAGRIVLGFGLGAVYCIGNPLISAFFSGDKRAKIQSFAVFFMYGGGMIMQMFCGILCDINFWLLWLTNAIAIIPLFLILFCLKEPSEEQLQANKLELANEAKAGDKAGGDQKLNPISWGLALIACLGTLVSMPLLFGYSSIVALYTDSVTVSSTLQTLWSLGNVLGGVAFAVFYRYTKKLSICVGYIVSGIGMALVAAIHSFVPMGIGMFIGGLGWSLMLPGVQMLLGIVNPPRKVAFGTSLMLCGINLMALLSSPFIVLLKSMFPGNPIYGPIWVGIILTFVLALFGFIFRNKFYPEGVIEQTLNYQTKKS